MYVLTCIIPANRRNTEKYESKQCRYIHNTKCLIHQTIDGEKDVEIASKPESPCHICENTHTQMLLYQNNVKMEALNHKLHCYDSP